MRFHAGEMDQIEKEPHHRLAYTMYDESDGLQPGTQMWQNGAAGVRDMAGRIWVVNGPGMTIIYSLQLREARRSSPPSLKSSPSTASASTRLPSGDSRTTARCRSSVSLDPASGDVEAALPPPARGRRRGLGGPRRWPARQLRKPSGR